MSNLRRIPNPKLDENINIIDENFTKLNNRRIKKLTKASVGSTDSETISDVLEKLNALIDSLNSSDLTF